MFLSLCTSKAGINISLVLLLIISFIIFFQKKDEYLSLIKEKPILFSVITSFIGVIVSYTSNFELSELTVFLNKGILFFCLPGLILLLKNKSEQKIAFCSYLIGLIFAIILAGHNWYKISNFHIENLTTTRIDSFWDLGRWTEILVYSLSLIIPFIFESKKNISTKILLSVLSFAIFVCMILSGGRAAIVALSITGSLYLLFRRPRLMLAIAIIFFAAFSFFSSTPIIKPIYERTISITNIHNQYSNVARLVMWSSGLEMLEDKLYSNPSKLLLGSGFNHFETDLNNHLLKKNQLNLVSVETKNQFSFTDSHNTFLDLANKIGIIYLFGYILILISYVTFFMLHIKTTPSWSFSGIGLILNHILFGFFYTSGLQYQTVILFFLVSLCFSNIYFHKKERREHV